MGKNWTLEDFEAKFQRRRPGVQEAKGLFSVLVPLVKKNEELHLLFEVRSEQMRGQPGETCFPGGRIEKGESPKRAALRETCEEIGIPEEQIEIIAPLDIVQDISSRVIYPYLGYLKEDALEHLKLNKNEVKEVFLVPLSYLRENPPYVYTGPLVVEIGKDFPYEKIGMSETYNWRKGTMDVPVYEYGNYSIWGITGRMVRWLLQVLEEEED